MWSVNGLHLQGEVQTFMIVPFLASVIKIMNHYYDHFKDELDH